MARARFILRIVLALFYASAGLIHLFAPETFAGIMPGWVPWPRQTILLTGVAELAGAAGLFIPQLRRAAGIGLALYAICVFPANINHAVNNLEMLGAHQSWWYHGPRLALQPVLVWLALWVGGVFEWPLGKAASLD